ncbi:hypothetical protein JCM10450v2_007743 [Rhodotorula kratochvilovae]
MEAVPSPPASQNQGVSELPARSPSPSPAPPPAAAPARVEARPQEPQDEMTSLETTSTPHIPQGAFSSANAFPVLSSAPPSHAPPAEVDEDAAHKDQLPAQHVDSRTHEERRPLATFVLPNQAAPPPPSAASSLHMTATGDGAARLAHVPYPFQPQYPLHSHSLLQHRYPPAQPEPRSVPMQRSPPPAFASPSLAAALPTYAVTSGQISSSTSASEGGGSSAGSAGALEKVAAADEARRAAGKPSGEGDKGVGASRLDLLAEGASEASGASGRKRDRDDEGDRERSTMAGGAEDEAQSVRIVQTDYDGARQIKQAAADEAEDKSFERVAQRRRFNEPQQPAHAPIHHLQPQYQQLPNLSFQQTQAQYFPYHGYGPPPPPAPSSSQAMHHYGGFVNQMTATQYGVQMHAQHQYASAGPPPPPPPREVYNSDDEESQVVEPRRAASSPAVHYQPQPQAYEPYRFGSQTYGFSPASQPAGSPSTVATSPSVALAQPAKRTGVPLVSTSATPQAQGEKQPFGPAPAAAPAQEEQGEAAPEKKKYTRGVKCPNPYPIDSITGVKPFISKLRWLLQHEDEVDGEVCWSESGQAVLVHVGGANEHLVDEVLPRTFGHSNVGNFTRQFTAYNFIALKDPAFSRELNPPHPMPIPPAASTSSAAAKEDNDDDAPEPRDPREWKVYVHQHSDEDYAAAREEERAAAAQARATAKARRAAVRQAAARTGSDIEVGAGGEESSSEEGDGEEDAEEEDDGGCWFTRESVEDVRMLRRLKPKASKGKTKSATGASGRTKSDSSAGAEASQPAVATPPVPIPSGYPPLPAAAEYAAMSIAPRIAPAPAPQPQPQPQPAAVRFDPSALGGLRHPGLGGGGQGGAG